MFSLIAHHSLLKNYAVLQNCAIFVLRIIVLPYSQVALCSFQGSVCFSMGKSVKMCLDTRLSQSCVTFVTYPGFDTLPMRSIVSQ